MVGMMIAGWGNTRIAEYFGVHVSTVQRIIALYNSTGDVKERARSGRPRITTRAQDHYITTVHLMDRFKPATTTSSAIPDLRRISPQTVRNRLREAGLNCYRAAVRITMKEHHKKARLAFAREHQPWRQRQWSKVVFTDESRFCLQGGDGRARVWRRKNERFSPCCIREQDRFRGGSVMVWASIDSQMKSELVVVQGNLTASKYVEQIVDPHLAERFQRSPDLILCQDNARPHSARLTRNHLDRLGVTLLPFPAKSPDLNPIEHAWDLLEQRLRSRPDQPTTLPELRSALVEEWNNIPRAAIRKLICSMKKRLEAVIKMDGGHTKY